MSGHLLLVTGASSGFGAAIVARAVADGDRVVATARRRDRLEEMARQWGTAVLPLALDVTDAAAVAGLEERLPESWKEIDVLVNNAGLALGLEPAPAADLGEWDRMIDTNCRGLVHCTRSLLPAMVARGRGHVVNVGSTAGRYPYPGGNVYGATKAFLHQFSLNLRADLVGTGIRVTSLEPGMAGGSEFSEVRLRGDRERAQAVYAGTQPLQPEDVAEAVSWVTHLPAHVNVNVIEVMPTAQAPGPLQVHREPQP